MPRGRIQFLWKIGTVETLKETWLIGNWKFYFNFKEPKVIVGQIAPSFDNGPNMIQ